MEIVVPSEKKTPLNSPSLQGFSQNISYPLPTHLVLDARRVYCRSSFAIQCVNINRRIFFTGIGSNYYIAHCRNQIG